MEIVKVETIDQLKELYDASAMTWEGLRKDNFEYALELAGQAGALGFLTKGKVMNEFCKLTGDNAYPDDLNIFSIKNFKGLAIQYGARWIDDVIDNNARRQKHHPFGGCHYGN
jgi:hypothetical protein